MRPYRALLIVASLLALSTSSRAGTAQDIAVVENQFDPVEKCLRAYRIPFNSITYRDLEDESTLPRFRAVFFPCGVDVPIETSINILARGTSIQGVFLKQDYHEINRDLIHRNIRSFIDRGGLAYFSGFSYDLLQGAFGDFSFFNDFPHMGLAGKKIIFLEGDLESFCCAKSLPVFESHSGWVAIRALRNAELLARGKFETAAGSRSGPVAALFRKGSGAAYYTAYHSDDGLGPQARFFVHRLAFNGLLEELEYEAGKWEQEGGARIVDTIVAGENTRQYSLRLARGMNTLYFKNEKAYFQMDIVDGRNNLVLSRQCWEREFSQDIRLARDGAYTLRLYPAGPERYVPFAVIAGSGLRMVPYWRKGVLALLCISVVLVLFWVNRIISPRKYSRRSKIKVLHSRPGSGA